MKILADEIPARPRGHDDVSNFTTLLQQYCQEASELNFSAKQAFAQETNLLIFVSRKIAKSTVILCFANNEAKPPKISQNFAFIVKVLSLFVKAFCGSTEMLFIL